jgi:hypothetical protein
MAEFKLGRIKFVWKGLWQVGTTYIVDDVVSNGGKSYICVVNHTASSEFNTDLSVIPSKWNIVADGTTWRGDWTGTTYYNAGDIVKYGALVYVCNTGHESDTFASPTYNGLEIDIDKWDLFATSFRWTGAWAVTTRYLKNDFVVYGGTTYICKNGHISAGTATAGLEQNAGDWDVFNQGIVYLGAWSSSSVRYKLNDIVKYGADLWICTNQHTSSSVFDEANWDVFINGFEFESSWNSTTKYQIGDTVTYGGYSYIAKTNNDNKQPTSYAADWAVFTTGFNYRGEYDVAVNYLVGDVITLGAYTYVALLDNIGYIPPNVTYWNKLNNGFKWTDNVATYSAVAALTVTGIGSGAKFDVIRSGTVYSVSVTSLQTGANYVAGDTIKILGSLLGGISPANDILITINTVSAGAIATFSWEGRSVTWTAGIDYVLGDVVLLGANTYVCIDQHESAILNRPDNDYDGSYWNLMTAGAEINILTETGDLVYYGANGPTRLPVGTNGQVLRSQDGFPVWANYGLINNLVYVGPLGRDVPYPSAGATIDQPWRSVRYAAKQIEDGYLNPNAKLILRKNKQFLMKEITNWVISTYSFNITAANATDDYFTCDSTATMTANMPIEFSGTIGGVTAGQKYFVKTVINSTQFTISSLSGGTLLQLTASSGSSMTGTLSYDRTYCERDVGLIVNALIYDISRGGNAKTVAAAKAYFSPAGNAYINSNFGTQIIQTVASYNYLSQLINVVLSNVPAPDYQSINGIVDSVPQIIDTSLVAEEFTGTLATSLISIITTAITAGSITAVPVAVNPTTTISVKTGTFQEVLPIVIPEYAAIVGDELRSTVIQPAVGNPLLVNDKEKTIAALNRISNVAVDLLQNNQVSPTSGNTVTQNYLRGFAGDPTVSTAVGTNTTIISDIVTNGLGSVPSTVISDPVGYDTGFFNARRLIVANKAFAKAEVSAWISSRIAGNFAPFVGFTYGGAEQTQCERDVGYIIDAIEYDISYGGNLETIVAARAYYSFGTYVGDAASKLRALAVQAHIKSFISYLAQNDNFSWTKTPANAQLQVTSGTAGSLAGGTFAQNRIQELYDTINTGIEPIVIEPGVSWVDVGLVSAKYAIQEKRAGIQSGAIAWVQKNYPTLSFDTAICSRDIGYIVDAIAYDIMFESNFRSIKAGMAYYRGTASAQLVIANQKAATAGVIGYVSTAIQQITNGSYATVGSTLAVSSVIENADTIYNIVASGLSAVPSIRLPNPTGLAANTINARTQLAQNYAFIKADVSQYLINVYTSVWNGLGAEGQAACQRDIGYMLDAAQYDLTYGGNLQSLIAGSAYYSNFTLTFAETELAATIAGYGHFKSIVGQIAQKQTVTAQAGNLVSQVVTGSGDALGTAATFAQARIQDVIDWISNGYANATITPSITWASTELKTAFATVQEKKTEITSDTVQWVYKNHQDLNFNADTCSRDTGYIVDALCYDFVFGSNFASVTSGRSYLRATPSALIVINRQKEAELGAINFIKYKVKSIAASGAVAQVATNINDITKFIIGGATPKLQWPNPTTIVSGYSAANVLLTDNRSFIVAETSAYIAQQIAAGTTGFVGLEYSAAACERDVGYIIDAIRYDLTYGYGISGGSSNYAVRQAGLAYYSGLTSVLQIDPNDKTATLAAYAFVKTTAQAVVQNTTVSALQVAVPQVRAAAAQTVGSAGSATSIGTLVDVITAIINSLGSAPAEVLPGTAWVSTALIAQNAALQANRASVQATILTYINTNFPTLDYNSATCERDIGLIIDAVGYDMMFNSNYRSVLAGNSYYRAQASLVLADQKAATVAAFRYLKTLLVAIVNTDTTATLRVKTLMNIIIGIVNKGVGETPEVVGTIYYNNVQSIAIGAEILRLNQDFLANEATAYISNTYKATVTSTTASTGRYTTAASHTFKVGDPVVFSGTAIAGSGITVNTTYFVATVPSTTTFTLVDDSSVPVAIASNGTGSMLVTYAYDPVAFRRDMSDYVDALIYDLQYTGNYKSLRAAQLYKNAVEGSNQSDMFLVSNATGLRNCTLSGLNGTLTEGNDYGTKRPTAGAYVALNPGFGPNDSNVWVLTRSHYSQNVTMFGTGCTGAKIDGAIHAGGNRSMVKNDFTTILSDGIGVWCTGANSLTELVSVFNYYGYAGYMAELGGRIRATNGNSSYGTYGVIAEGTDTYEQAINAEVDNHNAQAVISNTFVDGTKILRVEFQNAGTDYTNVAFSIGGDGINIYPQNDEFRDRSIFETRLIDLNDGNGYGGSNYGGAINASQNGDVGYITIAAADVALSSAYIGMRIQLTAGTGVGQYANILTYSNGTKIAKIYKDSFTTLSVTASQVSNNLITVASTATLYVGMPLYFGTAFGTNIAANTVYYIIAANFSTTQFAVSLSLGGTAISLTAATGLSVPLYAAGWDHAVPGTPIVNLTDLTTAYSIEPRISYTAPGYTATAQTLAGSAQTWKSVAYGNSNYVAITGSGTATSYSADGKTWLAGGALSASATWSDVVYGGGQGATATVRIGGLGGSGAILTAVMGTVNAIGLPGVDQVVSVIIVDGGRNYTTPPTIVFTPVSGGSGATATCTVLNGKIDTVTVTINGSGYTVPPTSTAATDRVTIVSAISWGRGYTSIPEVTISAPFAGSAWAGTTSVSLNAYIYSSSGNYYRVTVAGTTGASSPTHTSGSAANGGATLLYVGAQATATANLLNAGVSGFTITNYGAGYSTVPTVSILDTNAKFVAIASGSTNVCYLPTSGAIDAAWTASTAFSSSVFVALAYGVSSGTYVAVGGTNNAVSSTTGINWTSRTLPTLGSGTYIAIAWGAGANASSTPGTFVAISTGASLSTAVSANGATWASGGNLPAGFTTATSIAYGNGRFVAIASGTRTVTYSIDNGVTWRTQGAGLPSSQSWSKISYGQGLFIAVATGTTAAATSPDGINWTAVTMPGSSTNWRGLVHGNANNVPLWAAISGTSGSIAASINTGATTTGRMIALSGILSEVRLVEPGSSYPAGTVTATTDTTNVISVDNTENLVDSQPVSFEGLATSGLIDEKMYFVIGSTIVTNTSFKVSLTAGSSTPVVLSTKTGLTKIYRASPIVTQTDPNKVKTAALQPRQGTGVLANPSYSNRGTGNTSATSSVTGDGRAGLFQPSTFIAVKNLYRVPQAGSNIAFGSIAGVWYKLVSVTNVLGTAGEYTATLQVSPAISVLQAPPHEDPIVATLKYSQVRLTGHDFLYIGTGNQADTNYPYVDASTSIIANQTNSSGGGRVFFTSTDQDGNFNVGGLFGVQQSTGTATLNADAFNLSGLQSLQLGSLNVGVGSAVINQFSTDPYFTANSDNIVPTQKAIKSYITAQIGGGQSSLNVNTLTAGVVYIANDSISTTSLGQLNITAKMNFTGGIDGAPVALGYFFQR